MLLKAHAKSAMSTEQLLNVSLFRDSYLSIGILVAGILLARGFWTT
ncbi:MAG: hypothetical protein QXK88_06500 [Desulfurococcaceae archaeon]